MSFSDHADARIKAALETVLTQSADAAQRELAAFRTAVDARYEVSATSLAATYEALNAAMRAELIAELTRLADEEARAVADAVRRDVLEQSQRQLEAERLDMRDRLEAAQADAQARLKVEQAALCDALGAAQVNARAELEAAQATLRAELEAETAEKVGALAEALEGAQAEIVRLHAQRAAQLKTVEAQHKTSLAQVEAAHAEAEAARAETRVLIEAQARLETALVELRTQLQTERATIAGLSKDLEQVQVEAEQAREDAEAARDSARTQVLEALALVETMKTEVHAVRSTATQALADVPATQAEEPRETEILNELNGPEDSAAETPEDGIEVFPAKEEPTIESTPTQVPGSSPDGLLDAFLTINAATSLGEVLNALLAHLAGEFSRAALFVVKDGRLHGWRSAGFHGPATFLQKFEMPLTADSLLTRAILHRQTMVSDDFLDTNGFSSAEKVQSAIALPICIADSVVAVAYADGGQPTGDDQARAPRLHVAETLISHAARRLTTLLETARAVPGIEATSSSALEVTHAPVIAPQSQRPRGGNRCND